MWWNKVKTVKPRHHYTNVIARSPRLTAHANVINNRFEGISFAPFLKYLIDIVPESMLDVLADEFSLTVYEGWGFANSPEIKRRMLKESVSLHQIKGTDYSIERILEILGFGRVRVVTGLTRLRYDGTGRYDGTYFYGAADKWAYYRVVFLDRPVANNQVNIIKKILESFEAAHMVLLSLNYKSVAITYDGTVNYEGKYNYGEITGG